MDLLNNLTQISSSEFSKTKETIQKFASLLIDIKSKFSPHNKNSEEYSLKFCANGFTTAPIPIQSGNVEALDLNLDLYEHKLEILFRKERHYIELKKSNLSSFAIELQGMFNSLSIPYIINDKIVSDNSEITYNEEDAELLWTVIRKIYFSFVEFGSSILKEASSINFWPHHFDIAMLLFSGKIIEGQDKSNWSYSREQINFGFLFGDEFITKPYFYVTIYPFNNLNLENKFSSNAYWYTNKWNGAILELEHVLESSDSTKTIIDFFEEVIKMAPERFSND